MSYLFDVFAVVLEALAVVRDLQSLAADIPWPYYLGFGMGLFVASVAWMRYEYFDFKSKVLKALGDKDAAFHSHCQGVNSTWYAKTVAWMLLLTAVALIAGFASNREAVPVVGAWLLSVEMGLMLPTVFRKPVLWIIPLGKISYLALDWLRSVRSSFARIGSPVLAAISRS